MRHTFDQTSGSPQWWFTCRLKSQVGTNCLSFETQVVIIIIINSSSWWSSWMVRKKSLDTLHTLAGQNHFQAVVGYKTACVMTFMKRHNKKPVNIFVWILSKKMSLSIKILVDLKILFLQRMQCFVNARKISFLVWVRLAAVKVFLFKPPRPLTLKVSLLAKI